MRLPEVPKKGLYWKFVPLILAAASLLLFVVSLVLLAPWSRGWMAVLLLFLLSIETFFLPYLLLPLALRLPALMPWVKHTPSEEFSIDGEGRLAQRIILGALIILAGLPILTAHDASAPSWVPAFLGLPAILILSARSTAIIFLVLTLVLAVPDFGGEPSENDAP